MTRVLSELRERLRTLLFRRREEAELDEELRHHVELEAGRLVRERDLDPMEARRRALLKLGGVDQTKEQVRDARGVRVLEDLARDVRRGVRRLRRESRFSVPVILTLALGIGTVTAIFSVVDATLLRPLPFEDDGRLVRVHSLRVPFRAPGLEPGPKRSPDVTDLDSLDHVFSDHATYASGNLNLTGTGDPRRIAVALVTPSFFSTFGVMPRLGRPFNAGEGTPEGARAAILSDGVWRTHFGADPD
ncbi:MAG: ABC transporter permease, partial [Gemmatimonadota bacterium]